MEKFIDNIPLYVIPKSNFLNINAYRCLKQSTICISDFLPSFVTNKKRIEYFNSTSQIKAPSDFSLSLFKDRNSIETMLKSAFALSKKTIGFGVGNTTEEFGIATPPSAKGHINYFLYDYKSNNPCYSFKFVKR